MPNLVNDKNGFIFQYLIQHSIGPNSKLTEFRQLASEPFTLNVI